MPPISTPPIILASSSEVRQQMLRQARIPFEVVPARIDEEMARAALVAEGAKSRDVADALAEFKARKVAEKHPDAVVIGCDQVLDFEGGIISKPENMAEVRNQLGALQGKAHRLFSAVVVYEGARPVWRQIGEVTLTMRPLSDAWLDDYVARNWDRIRHSVGGYRIEEEGVTLFSSVRGEYFAVLGLPLIDLIGYFAARGFIPR